MARIGKTAHGFDWEQGHYTRRELSRSFDTLEDARRFAEGKTEVDIFVSRGRYVVTWILIKDNN